MVWVVTLRVAGPKVCGDARLLGGSSTRRELPEVHLESPSVAALPHSPRSPTQGGVRVERTVLMDASTLVQSSAVASARLIALVVAFQVALATGAPWGRRGMAAASWRARANCQPDTG